MNDPINPAHYKRGQVECIDAIEAATEGLSGREAVCTGNAIKYLWRWKEKGGHEDLKKAIWYISRIIGEGPTEFEELRAENNELHTELERVSNAIISQSHEISQTLGKALGYPKFSDDQKNFPGSTGDGVCVGEHVAETLAMEAATMIANLRERLDKYEAAEKWITDLFETNKPSLAGSDYYAGRAYGLKLALEKLRLAAPLQSN